MFFFLLQAKLLLFPEGKRHSGNQLLPLKKGGFHVAIDAQIPIQPVVVSRYYFLNSKAKKFDSGNKNCINHYLFQFYFTLFINKKDNTFLQE